MTKNVTASLRLAIERAFGIEIKGTRARSRETTRAILDVSARKPDAAMLDAITGLLDALGGETQVLLKRQEKSLRKAIAPDIQITLQESLGVWTVRCSGLKLDPARSTPISVSASGSSLAEALEKLAQAIRMIDPLNEPSAAPPATTMAEPPSLDDMQIAIGDQEDLKPSSTEAGPNGSERNDP